MSKILFDSQFETGFCLGFIPEVYSIREPFESDQHVQLTPGHLTADKRLEIYNKVSINMGRMNVLAGI